MHFDNGYWLLKPGVQTYQCEQIRQVKLSEDRRELYLFTVPYRENMRSMEGCTMEVVITSPQPDQIRFQAVHFKGDRRKYRKFQIDDQRLPLEYQETDDTITVTSGSTKLVIGKKAPVSFEFFYGDEKLTEIGRKNGSSMLSYITTPEGNFMRCQTHVGVGEKIYGMGERFTPFVRNGQSVEIWNEDGGTSTQISYKNVPFYLSSRNYGVFVNEAGPVSFEVCSAHVTKVQFSVPAERLDFIVIGAADRKGVLSGYTALTGRPALPPAWSFGLWLTSSFTTSYDEQTVNSFVDGMAQRDIPLGVFHFDCFWMKENEWCGFEWDEDVFPDVEGLLARLHGKGLKICVWINPYIGQKSAIFDEAAEKGYLLKRPNGDIWQWDRWQGGMGVVDFTNPEAVKWYQGHLRRLMKQGVDCFKTDFGERIPTDVVYYDGSDPEWMHNYYPFLYNKAVFDVLKEVKGEGEACVFARSATAGSQQFPVHWGGDCSGNYESMSESLRGGLSLCLSGFGFWSHDIGGFEGFANPDVYKRWLAFGLLSTHSRLHGADSYRVPWLFGEEAVDVCRHFAKLKNKLMPYLYAQAVQTHETGIPMMRAMVLEFDELGCEDCDRQYMLGDRVLVAPVMRKDGIADFYLPRGKWTHLLSGEEIDGGNWFRREYDFFSLPLFVRENSILALGAREDITVYDYAEDLTLRIYQLGDNKTADCRVCDSKGQTVLTAHAKRSGDTITVKLSGKTGSVKVEQIGTDCRLEIVREQVC